MGISLITSHINTLVKDLTSKGIILGFTQEKQVSVSTPTRRKQGSIKALLGSLDDVFSSLGQLRNRKSPTQKVIKKVGVFVHTEQHNNIGFTNTLEGFNAYKLPSILSYYSHKSDEDVDHIVIARKIDKVPFNVPTKDCVYYDVTLVCNHEGNTAEFTYFVRVNKNTGQFVPIKSVTSRDIVVAPIGRTFARVGLGYPDLRNEHVLEKGTSIYDHLCLSFSAAYNITMQREYGTNIIVKKGKHKATFVVPENEWKYFFKDRVKVQTATGTKRIFHAVKSHIRHTTKGDQSVKTHYRGLRHFVWDSYEVSIIIPGKHGVSQASLDLTGTLASKGKAKLVAMSDALDAVSPLFDPT